MRENQKIKLIAFDLDGTLLTSAKELSKRDREALERAADMGIELVPATGRFFSAIPEVVRFLSFLRYAITINGAQVFDIRRHASISSALIPLEQAIQIMRFLETLPVIYDVVMDDCGYMEGRCYDRIDDFTLDEHQARMLKNLRRPVDGLLDLVRDRGLGVQKIQPFTLDAELRAKLIRELPTLWPDTAVSSSYSNNVEINSEHADKGTALEKIADYLSIPMTETLAFGDGLNDVSMLRKAGIGVAMENACDEARTAADFVTSSCDDGGVAAGIERFCFSSIP